MHSMELTIQAMRQKNIERAAELDEQTGLHEKELRLRKSQLDDIESQTGAEEGKLFCEKKKTEQEIDELRDKLKRKESRLV